MIPCVLNVDPQHVVSSYHGHQQPHTLQSPGDLGFSSYSDLKIFNKATLYTYLYERRTQLLTTRNGHGQSGWSPIGCEGFNTKLNIPSPFPTTVLIS